MRFGVVIAGSKKLRESAYLEAFVSRRISDGLELSLSFFAILTHKLQINTPDTSSGHFDILCPTYHFSTWRLFCI